MKEGPTRTFRCKYMGNTIIGLLAYADDVVLVTKSEEDIVEQTKYLLEATK